MLLLCAEGFDDVDLRLLDEESRSTVHCSLSFDQVSGHSKGDVAAAAIDWQMDMVSVSRMRLLWVDALNPDLRTSMQLHLLCAGVFHFLLRRVAIFWLLPDFLLRTNMPGPGKVLCCDW